MPSNLQQLVTVWTDRLRVHQSSARQQVTRMVRPYIDRASAKAIALKYMNENFGRDPELAIVDGEPSEITHAWVFFYNTRRYLETGEFSDALAGNGPILVNKRNGDVAAFGMAISLETLFADYEEAAPYAIVEDP